MKLHVLYKVSMLSRLILLVMLLTGSFFTKSLYAQEQFVAGRDYTVLESKVEKKVRAKDEKIVITEFFSFLCPYCYNFDPLISNWALQNKNLATLVLVSVPGANNQHPWTKLSRLYYTVVSLGFADQAKLEIYKTIHKDKQPMATEEQMWNVLKVYAEQKKISQKQFVDTYNSFQTSLQVDKARQIAADSGIEGTPAIMVDNRFVVQASQAKGFDRMLAIAKYLAEEARSGRL